MKNIFLMILITLFFASCGGVKDSVKQEVFTDSEKALFNTALQKYKAKDLSSDIYITGNTSDTLLTISGTWHDTAPNPYYGIGDSYEYWFTKENSIFICRAYRGDDLVTTEESKDFTTLLEDVLYISL